MKIFKLVNKIFFCFLFVILIFTHFKVTADESPNPQTTEATTAADGCCTKNITSGNVTDSRPGEEYQNALKKAGLPVLDFNGSKRPGDSEEDSK
ncbi:MAG: hypothetical protein K1X29_07590 [Bdellovibrionales bacterium]|nr:hypothetical protein [Bdellovibrionales bacterium]